MPTNLPNAPFYTDALTVPISANLLTSILHTIPSNSSPTRVSKHFPAQIPIPITRHPLLPSTLPPAQLRTSARAKITDRACWPARLRDDRAIVRKSVCDANPPLAFVPALPHIAVDRTATTVPACLKQMPANSPPPALSTPVSTAAIQLPPCLLAACSHGIHPHLARLASHPALPFPPQDVHVVCGPHA